ncbi:fumarylacetoacetate hydrolase family protein [Sphingomonas sp.]|uniref:fumarylacetoacetate hydrolase family protein n=1 Tax=Sphingomonas sp. TaxID=28214 RepID=UPI002DD6A69E|nr:fumarylacetoacetate hydrolase family protein [Sphingomonas sp.]
MKLVRFGAAGEERPGAVAGDGTVRDLSTVVADIAGPALSPEALDRLRAIDLAALPVVPAGTRLGPCIGHVRHFIAVGLNYADHAAESGAAVPDEPILFSKAPSCIVGPDDDVLIPPGSAKTDWEVELAVVIGRRASHVPEAEADGYVAGYCVCNDVSERAYQMERGGQWMKGKGCPTFGPLGPWLVTRDEIADVQSLDMWLDIDGTRMQTGNTRTMIFPVRFLVSYISQFMILEPGDVITTGTPPGVGLGMKPPRYLRGGERMELGIAGLGIQRQRVVTSHPA